MPSYQQLQYRMFMKRAGYLALIAAIGVAAYLVIQSERGQEFLASLKSVGKVAPEKQDTSEELGLGEFEEFLLRASTQQLILRSTELVDDPSQEVLIRLDKQQRKQRVAEKLLEQTGNERAIDAGIASKLDAMRTSQLIKFDNGLTDVDSIDELKKFATTHASSFNERVDQQAAVTRVAAQVISDLMLADLKDGQLSDQTILEFGNVCRKFKDNEFVAMEMFGLLERIYVHASDSQQSKFAKAFKDGYSTSELARLQKLAENVGNRLVESEFELVNIFDSVESLRGEAVKKLRDQVMETFESSYVSTDGYQRIFAGIRDVVRVGDYETALELSEALHKQIGSKSALRDLAEKNLKLRQQLKLVGKNIPDNVLLDFDGSAYTFKYPNAKLKAACFMPEGSFKKSDVLLFKIMRIAGRAAANKEFCLTAVYIDYGRNPKSLQEIKKTKELISIVDFCRIDANSPDGKKFVEQLAIIEPPMLMLMDQAGKIIAIDLTEKDFENRFFELIK